MPYTHGKSIIKIAYADADLTMQELLPPFIDSFENCKVIIQATSGLQLLEKLHRKPETNLIISDIVLPELDGIETTKRIKQEFPELKILFTSVYDTEVVYSRIMQVQGNGFVPKGSSTSELKKGIQEIMRAGYYFPANPAIIKHYHLNGNGNSSKSKNTFSEEEICFMKLIKTNLTYEGIAAKMKCSKRHIDYIREGLFHRFDVHSKVELLSIAAKSGLTEGFYSYISVVLLSLPCYL
jgi:two-component system, NarL family, invasion response regulator UvrY